MSDISSVEKFAYPVVSAIIESIDGKILLQKRNKLSAGMYRGFYELPQGRLRQGETLIDCICREVQEETGLTDFKPKDDIKHASNNNEVIVSLTTSIVNMTGTEHYLAIVIVGSANGNTRSTDEATDHIWCSETEVNKFLQENKIFPLNIPMLENYYNRNNSE